jgi:hypothetical protein
MSKTIFCFDSWTAGSHLFARLVPAFRSKGYKLVLIHIGSWGHDKGRRREEQINGLLVRDISYYQEKNIGKILSLEKPVAVILLSTRAFAHMAVLRYAKQKEIPTCHLYHGLVRVQAVDDSSQPAYKTSLVSHARLLTQRTIKNISILIPIYVRALIETRADRCSWYDFFAFLLNRMTGRQKAEFLLGTETTIGCVYTSADVSHMARNYRISRGRIFVVGNPDLISFGLEEKDLASALIRHAFPLRQVLYIDTALVPAGQVFKSDAEFVNYLMSIKSDLECLGYTLLVKLHPAHGTTNLPNRLRDLGFDLCENKEFKDQLLHSAAVITEPSSAAMIPSLLGLPLFLSNLGSLKTQRYGEVLTSYPLARQLYRMADFESLLLEMQKSTQHSAVLEWIRENSGPLPAHDMPMRVAEAIDSLVRRNEATS